MGKGLAARVAAWQRRAAGLPSSSQSLGGYSEADLSPKVELFLNEQWVDISDDIRYSDGVSITRGRSDESRETNASTCKFTLDNAFGKYSPRNPLSPYFGVIGRNTPCRASILQNGIRRYRFYGEVSEWPVRWDNTGRNVYTAVEASGILRRLNQGAAPLKSTIFREQTSPPQTDIVAYWPCEDGKNANSIASALPVGRPMTIVGSPSLASSTEFACSDALPTVGTSQWSGAVTPYTVGVQSQIQFLCFIPSDGLTNGAVLVRVHTSGTAARWDVVYTTANNGSVDLRAYDADGNNLFTSATSTGQGDGLNGLPWRMSLDLTQDGANIDWQLWTAQVGWDTASGPLGTQASRTVGAITRVAIGPTANVGDAAIGHVTVRNSIQDILALTAQLAAYTGESAGRRIERLCTEEGISLTPIGSLDDTEKVGPQTPETLLELLQECVIADMGQLFEPRDQFGLGYRGRTDLYNRADKLTLSYSNHELAESLAPMDDDQSAVNDITVTRGASSSASGGSSARATLNNGPMSVLPPPDGIGRYDSSVTVNVATDGQLDSQASWRLFLGTLEEARYPEVHLNLRHPSFLSNLDLMNAAMTFDAGDRIVIEDVPSFLPPDDISLLVQGYTETFDQFEHTMEINCSPASPYEVGVSDVDRYDTAGCELTEAISATTTIINITTTSGPLWTEDGSMYPFDIKVGGEVMTALLCSGGGVNPQSFTVTRSVNGIVKSHTKGTTLSLARPAVCAL